MNIKTITCHDVYNAGASLQAYALSAYLRQQGHHVQIIDYKPDYLSRHFSLTTVGNEKFNRPLIREAYLLAKLPERLRAKYSLRKRRYDAFRTEFLPLTCRYNSVDALRANPPQADIYFAGSDQIWNTMFPNGKDPAFYLDFAPKGSIKASYAASFATEDVLDDWKPQMKDWLHALDYISVRESSGVRIAQDLGIIGAVQVLDPVFLLDASTWRNMASERPSYPYLLVYDFDGNKQIEQEAKRLAAQHKLKIVTLQKLPYADRCIRDAGPREFLSLVDGASFVLSNSFHATAFSLIFQRPFMVYDRCENINTRMRDLMVTAGLSHRSSADAPIDWTTVQMRLDKEITASKAYIDSVLQGR